MRNLKLDIQEFHRKYVLVPADKAANNIVVVRRLHYINTLKQELSGTKAYEQTSAKEKFVINHHIFQNATRFGVSVDDDQERLPTFYWLPKLHKQPYKYHARLPNYLNRQHLALLLSKIMLLNTVKKSMKCPVKIFLVNKNSCEVINKLKSRGFCGSGLSTYDFSTSYITLPHNLINALDPT